MDKRLIILIGSIVQTSCMFDNYSKAYVTGPNRVQQDLGKIETLNEKSKQGNAQASYELSKIYGFTFKDEEKMREYLYLAKKQGPKLAKETIIDIYGGE